MTIDATHRPSHRAWGVTAVLGAPLLALAMGACTVRETAEPTTTTAQPQESTASGGTSAYATPAPGVREGHAPQPVAANAAVAALPSTGQLVVGGPTANFARLAMAAGFQPDPAEVRVTSGGQINAEASVAAGCPGWVSEQPDVIVDFTEMYGFLRFAFRADDPSHDTTLIINDPQGRWICNDDGVALNPMVDLGDAAPGQYDVWVGSFEAGAYVPGTLLVTELANVTP